MSFAEQMLAALEAGDIAQARELFQSVLTEDDDETKYNLAGELAALGFTGQAKRLYDDLLTAYPDQDDIRTALADIAVSDGHPDEALALLDAIDETSDAYPQALVAAADVYQTQGLYEVAERKLLQAQAVLPAEPVVTFALGELYFAWGKDEQAARAYATLINSGEDTVASVPLRPRYAATLANLGQFGDAVAVYEEVGESALDPASRLALGTLYLQLDEFERAIKVLQALVASDASYANAYLPLARAQEAANQPAAALATIQDGLAVDDTSADLYAMGARLAIITGDNDLATAYLDRAKLIDPENQAVMLEWSNLLYARGDDDANITYLKALDAAGDGGAQIYWNLAKSYDRTDQVALARENYLLAFGQFQDNPDFLHDVIDFFQSTHALAELRAALVRYLALVPDDLDMQERLDDLADAD